MKKQIPMRFEGLDDNIIYTFEIDDKKYEKTGAYLKNVGIPMSIRGMGYHKIIKIRAK